MVLYNTKNQATQITGTQSKANGVPGANGTNVVSLTSSSDSEDINDDDGGVTGSIRIKQYDLHKELGSGSFSTVYAARDHHGRQYLQLRRQNRFEKLRRLPCDRRVETDSWSPSPPEAGDNVREVKRVWREMDACASEVNIMKMLKHENVVHFYEVIDDDASDTIYMILEYCDKGSLVKVKYEDNTRNQSSPVTGMSEVACRQWFEQLVQAVKYLHEQNVIHRDIKPDNCLVSGENVLKLSDFGISEMLSRQGETKKFSSTAFGTPTFLAPELCHTHPGPIDGRAADVWAMGITLYYLRYGCLPFYKKSLLDLYHSIHHDDVPYTTSDDSSAEFHDLIRKILCKDPSCRITIEQIENHPWMVNCRWKDSST